MPALHAHIHNKISSTRSTHVILFKRKSHCSGCDKIRVLFRSISFLIYLSCVSRSLYSSFFYPLLSFFLFLSICLPLSPFPETLCACCQFWLDPPTSSVATPQDPGSTISHLGEHLYRSGSERCQEEAVVVLTVWKLVEVQSAGTQT